MRLRDPIVPCVASLLVPLLDALGGGAAFAQASRASLVLLTWFALALLPPAPGAPPRGLLVTLAFLAPPLGLGLGLDLAAGRSPGGLAGTVLVSVALLLLWGHARTCASASPSAARSYALAWGGLFPGLAALHVALDWAPGGTPPGAVWASLDPLVYTHHWGAAGGEATAPWAALVVAVLVVLGVRLAPTGKGDL